LIDYPFLEELFFKNLGFSESNYYSLLDGTDDNILKYPVYPFTLLLLLLYKEINSF